MNSEKLKEELFEQIEQDEQCIDQEESAATELMNKLFNTDDSIKQSFAEMENADDPSTNFAKNESKKQKKTMSAIADEVVTNYFADRSEKNWKCLQEFFWFGIKQFAYKIVDNWDDAYDMTIETFVRAYEAIDSYNPEKARFSTWIWNICRNNCLHFIAQKKKIPTINNDISEIYDSEIFSGAVSDEIDNLDFKMSDGNQLESVLLGDITEELYNVSINEMNSIGGVGQQIVEMKLLKNMKIREIADELNMNESTVKNYLYRSKENLSRLIIANHKELYDIYIDAKAIKNFDY